MRLTSLLVATLCLVTVAACDDDDSPGVTLDAGTIDVISVDANTLCPTPLPTPENCDFFLSCGCVQPSEKCSIRTDMRACVPFGAKQPGETCVEDGECEPASLCGTLDPTTRRCLAFCDDAHACGTGQACYVKVTSAVEATLCGQVCDLHTQNCELTTQACYPFSKLNQPGSGICVAPGAGIEGGVCKVANDCAKGLTCIGRDAKCAKMCDRGGGAPTCGAGQTCAPIIGQTTIGYCAAT
jgi:hypothetical protein